jgi:hypothetical protein
VSSTLADHVFQYLIAQGIVRDPRVAGPLPPAFRSPADGVPAPAEGFGTEIGPTAVVGIQTDLSIAAPFNEGAWRRDIVDIVYRTLKRPDADALYAQVRTVLVAPLVGTTLKMNWLMDGLRVIQSVEWQGLQRIDSSRAQGFTMKSAVLFETYAADHS